MMNTNKNYISNEILEVFCVDSLSFVDRVTFDYFKFKGMHVTCWMDDDSDFMERVNKMFDFLFEEIF